MTKICLAAAFSVVFFLCLTPGCAAASSSTGPADLPIVVFQPSHQNDTGENYNESETCNAIVEYALHSPPFF